MSTLKQRYQKAHPLFLRVLPMDDMMFIATLIANGMMPGNTKDSINAQPTKVKKAEEFLSKCIDPGFAIDDNSNDMLKKLLVNMENSGFAPAAELAQQFNSGTSEDTTKPTESLNKRPKFPELRKKFEKITSWESICPYLIEDDDGQKTMQIRRSGENAKERRDEMLTVFLEGPDPTWQKVVDALRAVAKRYDNLADEIEEELQG